MSLPCPKEEASGFERSRLAARLFDSFKARMRPCAGEATHSGAVASERSEEIERLGDRSGMPGWRETSSTLMKAESPKKRR